MRGQQHKQHYPHPQQQSPAVQQPGTEQKQNALVSRYAVIREERQREFEERQRQREELEQAKLAEIASYNVGDVSPADFEITLPRESFQVIL